MNNTSDRSLLEQLKTEENASFQKLYSLHFQSIAVYVKQNNGSSEDAEDIFQEGRYRITSKSASTRFCIDIFTQDLPLFHCEKQLVKTVARQQNSFYTQHRTSPSCRRKFFLLEIQETATREEKVGNWLSANHRSLSGCFKSHLFCSGAHRQFDAENGMEKQACCSQSTIQVHATAEKGKDQSRKQPNVKTFNGILKARISFILKKRSSV